MKLAFILSLALLANNASAHYIFQTLIAGSKTSKLAVRVPAENSPVKNYTSADITCNVNISNATETVSVSAGSVVGFELGEGKRIYHPGPISMYLGKAPGKAAQWNGTGKSWFKVAEWGATFSPFGFETLNKNVFTVKIPSDIPSGEYLVRMEQIALHIPGSPEFFVGCAQIKITGGGSGSPAKVSIPGYLTSKDPGLLVDIYWPIPTEYTVPGPPVYRARKSPRDFFW